MNKIKTIGIIGAGTMGSALAQKFAMESFDVILADISSKFIQNGFQRIKQSLNEGIEKKVLTHEKSHTVLNRIIGTDNLSHLNRCDIIIEAVFEDFKVKSELFKKLSEVVSTETILATNTSSFSISELSGSVSSPERFIGLHYFYHAAKNRLVEIIPGEKTSPEILKQMMRFSSQTGKDYILCKDSYGFVVNRFFVPWLNEAVRICEEGIASPAEIDAVCCKVFSIGMGPFALMNATGVPIAYHAQKTLERFGKLYKTSNLLKTQSESGQPWYIDANGDKIPDDKTKKIITDRMLGIVLVVCSQILNEKICIADEINRGARIGLRWRKGPVELMKSYGKEEVLKLIKQTCELYDTIIPKPILEGLKLNFVSLEKFDDKALITITRPEDLNALNWTVVRQLSEKFNEADEDPHIKSIFITGRGKAFVAGADIKFFLDNIKSNTIENIVTFTKYCQDVFQKVDKSKKKVIAVLNGLTLGGGLELALCADIILALPQAALAFPETGIGIYPGLGGTQRTQQRIGKSFTKYLIFTGDFVNAGQAEKIGLVDGVIQWDNFYDMLENSLDVNKFISKTKIPDDKYSSIENFFRSFSLKNISAEDMVLPFATDLIKKIKRKAPLALTVSEKLINEERGCESELENLKYIFSTSDALLGLSSIGKKVEFLGR